MIVDLHIIKTYNNIEVIEMERTKELNSRQWKLHEYLKENRDSFKSYEEIVNDLWELYDPTRVVEVMPTAEFHASSQKRLLGLDLKKIKASTVIKRVLIGCRVDGVKYANREEAIEYMNREEIEILSKLKRHHNQREKLGLHNQAQLQFTGYEKEFIESV